MPLNQRSISGCTDGQGEEYSLKCHKILRRRSDRISLSYDKYSVTQYSVSSILGYIEAGDIAIPEIQRPLVWKGRQVRDLIDSLYNGYPTGYLIIWQNPDVRLKDGGSAVGKKVLIDGQQRITALMTAIAGYPILTENYEEKTI